MNRLHSGIPGFDELVGGGIPERDIVLLSGECGAGKSVFGLQFLASSREHGVYVSFEDEVAKIAETAAGFGWDLKARNREGTLSVIRYDPFKLEDIIEIIESHIREISATRVVLDSVSALGMYLKNISDVRRMVLQLENVLRKNNCTAFLVSEIVPGRHGLSRFGVEEFVTDGVITLRRYPGPQGFRRGLTVLKMRGSEHSMGTHEYLISGDGVRVGEMISPLVHSR